MKEGYVELPYTLPQDFTLYILLKERSIDTWKMKIDLIVKNKGIALFITHPDYIRFSHDKKEILNILYIYMRNYFNI